MGPDLSHVPNARFSRLLIVANHISTYEALIRTFEDTRFDIDFDVCASYADAAGKLSASRYQLIISGVCLAELDDFLLLDACGGSALWALRPKTIRPLSARPAKKMPLNCTQVLSNPAFLAAWKGAGPFLLSHDRQYATRRYA